MTNKRVIHIGDGQHIEIEEGNLKAPFKRPIAPRVSIYRPGKPQGGRLLVDRHGPRKTSKLPWHFEWKARRIFQLLPHTKRHGRKPFQAIGQSKDEVAVATQAARERATRDMKKIKAAGADLTAAGEEALIVTLTVMRAAGDVRTKLAAARQVLEWSQAKPAASTHVTVNTAEDWLASLTPDDNDEQEHTDT